MAHDENDGATFPKYGGPAFGSPGGEGPKFGGPGTGPEKRGPGFGPDAERLAAAPDLPQPAPERSAERRVVFTGSYKDGAETFCLRSESEAKVVPAESAILDLPNGFSFALTVPKDATPREVMQIVRFIGLQANEDTMNEWFGGWLEIGSGKTSATYRHNHRRSGAD